MKNTAVKICCISSIEEAQIAIDHGASAVGLVSSMPSGPGIIPEKLIAKIADYVPEHVDTFLLTSHQEADKIIAQHQRCQTTVIQLVDSIARDVHRTLRKTLPDIKIVQVIHVNDDSSIQEAVDYAAEVDALLLDSGNPNLKTKQLGGTGRTHNWQISREIVRSIDIPAYLAGGLNPQNIADALSYVNPYGVDICSGLRTDGSLNQSKIARFFKEIKTASQ